MRSFIVGAFAYILLPHAIFAATYTVVTTGDTISGPAGTCAEACSLRDAIRAANASAGSDTISIPAGTYTLTFTGDGEDVAATGDLDITDMTGTLTITGAGSGSTIIDGNDADRIFDIKSGTTVDISGLTITDGSITNGNGGGILNAGTLTLSNAVVSSNELSANDFDYGGVGIACTAGTVTIEGSSIADNYSSGSGGMFVFGGGIYVASGCSGSVSDSSISSNTFETSNGIQFGGGVYITLTDSTTFDMINATIDSNSGAQGGGVLIESASSANPVDFYAVTISNNLSYIDGGGVYQNGPAKYTNVTVYGNEAYGQGGGIFFSNTTATVASMAATSIIQNIADVNDSTPDLIGGGVYVGGVSVDLSITGSIVAANYIGTGDGRTFNDCHVPASNGDSFIYSLLGTTSDCSFDTTTNSVLNGNGSYLGTVMLEDNGGLVQTLDVWSTDTKDVVPELNCVDADGIALTEDARGFARPDNGGCEMGAVEQDQTAPSAPTAFSASPSSSTVQLAWTNPVLDFSSVTIRRSSVDYPESVVDGSAVLSGSSSTSYDDVDLADGTYYYSIFALDSSENASAAAQATVTVDTTTMTPILTSPAAERSNSVTITYTLPEEPLVGSVQLSFVNSDNEIETFQMGVSQNVDFTFSPTSTSSELLVDNASIINGIVGAFDPSVLPDDTYTVQVSYQDASGNPSASASVSGYIVDTTAPSVVSDVIAEASGSTVILSWTNPVDADLASITVRRSAIDYPESILDGALISSGEISTSIEDPELPDSIYYYSIFGIDSIGNISIATEVSVLVDTVAPDAPTDFLAVQDGTNVHLTWTNPADSDFWLVDIQQQTGSYPATVHDGGTTVSGLAGTEWDNDGLSEGLHYFSIFAFDHSLNVSEAGHAVVFVDLTAPVITLNGEAEMTVEAGEEVYEDLGAIAVDAHDGAVDVQISGSVDTSVVGEYVLTYSATDAVGNAQESSRTVRVVDTTAPEITLVGDAEMTLIFGETYQELGAVATDTINGDVTDSMSIEGSVDILTPGEYVLIYTATDLSNNSASVTRTVTVSEQSEQVVPLGIISSNGKYVTVRIDDQIVDRVRINRKKVKPKFVKVFTREWFNGYRTVIVLVVKKNGKAKLTVARVKADNTITKVRSVVFDIHDRAHVDVKTKKKKKRIRITIGEGDNAVTYMYRVTKKGRIRIQAQ